MFDLKKIEKKWQKRWEAKRLFEANINKRKKFFTSNVIPYVNGNAHIGHTYTFTRTDAYARFKRMQGFNTLFAQGFHATGEPILGTVERLKRGDVSQAETYKAFGATDKNLRDFVRKGPKYVAQFWSKKMEESFRSIGYSIDWRRKFTLSIDEGFSKFVQWQYNTLKKKGYIVQGTHPVVWCPHDKSPTGDHDRLEGEGESPVQYTLIKFQIGDSFLPAATLRPETVYGVTNVWLNPHADYVKIEVDGEMWIVAKESIIKIKDQFKDVKELKEYDEKIDLFGKRARNPVTGRDVPIIPSSFVDPGSATGVVMSVPAHAPYDYVALEEFKASGEAERYGIAQSELEPIALVDTEMGEVPAKTICKSMNITSVKQEKELDEATSVVYKKEFHTGVLNDTCGPYAGMKVSDVKDRVIEDFIEKEIADIFYDVSGVVCRCTTKCHVKILENQWFLKYSDERWKADVKRCLEKMKIYPEEARNNFLATIDWMKDKACTRRSGLGTQLPWDKDWIVETLSDSTIYMAYYTIAHLVKEHRIENKLSDDVFDFVFSGKGDIGKVSKASKINRNILKSMRSEFEYFYPYDFRNSAKELVQNHLTFFLYHHTALFPEKYWPRCVSVNGHVNVEGEKMSKSKGNIVPLKDLVKSYGADMTRINIVSSSEGMDDADWRAENIKSFRMRYDFLIDVAKKVKRAKSTNMRQSDLYILSRLQKIIKSATEGFEATRFRTAVNHCLFDATNDLKWYLARCGPIECANRKVLEEYLSSIVKMLAPLTPHICEEIWALLGNKGFISISEWPSYSESMINDSIEKSEALVRAILDDIREIQKLKSIKPRVVKVFVAEDWKFFVHDTVVKNKGRPINDITREIMATDMKKYGNATVTFIQNVYKKINDLSPALSKELQIKALNDSREFLEKEIGCRIEVINADSSQEQKARMSTPQRPGILLE